MPTPLQAGRTPGDDLDLSLDDMVDLLSREIERLKASLEMYRLLDHPQKQDIILRHVQALDERQNRLDDLKDLLLARQMPHWRIGETFSLRS
ncbi:MAG: hypothetical protein FJ194_13920 [Gammaproteobacteria bacterium]|nr:hypothetical protein [Gammaproteobacteria bacterium]